MNIVNNNQKIGRNCLYIVYGRAPWNRVEDTASKEIIGKRQTQVWTRPKDKRMNGQSIHAAGEEVAR